MTPTGDKVKRVLMMGVLVEVDNVGTSGDYLRGRVIDPTGAFTVYAGQYQPEVLLALSNLTIPCFVAVVGKTSAYRPDEETTIVSIRLETIVEIDAKTRDYWVKETVARTLERVGKSQLPEAEKEKYRQMCKDALTKLIHTPPETNVLLPETPKEPAKKIPGIEEDVLKEEKITDTLPASVSEKPAEQPKPEKEFHEILRVQESKESKTKSNKPVKRQTKKKKTELRSANNSQKTLFT